MFPFDSESIFRISSNNNQIEIPENPMTMQEINYDAAADPLRMMIQATAADHKNPLPPSASNNNAIRGHEDDDEDSRKKKKKHREMEKQRRMEMASLFGDLRSLLPIEFIRGKRSMTDQMNEAVNYIRHLQTGIKELERKRDKIKNTTNPTSSCQDSSKYGISNIVVLPSIDGLQIMMREGSEELGVCPLSAVMRLLVQQEGVNVFSCSTSRIDDRTLYKIHCQVNDVASVDLTKLRLRLEALLG